MIGGGVVRRIAVCPGFFEEGVPHDVGCLVEVKPLLLVVAVFGGVVGSDADGFELVSCLLQFFLFE